MHFHNTNRPLASHSPIRAADSVGDRPGPARPECAYEHMILLPHWHTSWSSDDDLIWCGQNVQMKQTVFNCIYMSMLFSAVWSYLLMTNPRLDMINCIDMMLYWCLMIIYSIIVSDTHEHIYYSLCLQKNTILEQCHVLIYQVWPIIDKKNINIYNIK
jgi:hypothetical protein